MKPLAPKNQLVVPDKAFLQVRERQGQFNSRATDAAGGSTELHPLLFLLTQDSPVFRVGLGVTVPAPIYLKGSCFEGQITKFQP